MSWLSKAISHYASFVDSQFSTKLAAKYRQIDPIARLMGEDYQRHIWHVAAGASMGGGISVMLQDYFSGKNRGQDSATAWRHTYQDQVKSAAILATIYGASAAGGAGSGGSSAAGGGGSEVGADSTYLAGSDAAGAGGGVATGGGGATADAATGAVSADTAAGAEDAAIQAGTYTGEVATPGAAVAAPAAAPATGSPGLLNSVGSFLKSPGGAAALLVGGQALAAGNTPSAGEQQAGIIAANQRANQNGSAFGGRPPVILPYKNPNGTPSMSAADYLAAAGYTNPFDARNPTSGLVPNTGGLLRQAMLTPGPGG